MLSAHGGSANPSGRGYSSTPMPRKDSPPDVTTLPFDRFWTWLQSHANCILRAGTPEAVLFDDDDLHWHFGTDRSDLLVQIVRGKVVLGELVVIPSEITYVQVEPGEGDEFLFECISEQEKQRLSTYHFVLSHGYDDEERPKPGRLVH